MNVLTIVIYYKGGYVSSGWAEPSVILGRL